MEAVLIALTIFLEARGESYEGRKAVAQVIATRAVERKLSHKEVCLQPKQFSCWNIGYDKIIHRHLEGRIVPPAEFHIWRECLQLASQVIDGSLPSSRWNHYYNPRLANPRWGKQMKDIAMVGQHKFGRL